ncbi:MAG: DNA topoisomerase VI subunit B [Candidatus Aenigmatarchaeota archaeon]|nr:DNA topoisomerase VI subunit B [Candidatus Aenigmarchaeota archaeon]
MPTDASEELSKKLREISVAEFFEKNRHLLGFDNPAKAILTVVKEAVDNSLDACEQARILPEIRIVIKEARKNFRILDTSGAEIAQLVLEDGNAELRLGDNIIKPIEKKEGKNEIIYLFSYENLNYKFKIIKKENEELYEFVRGKTELKILKLPQDRYKIIVEDNGPGIVKEHVPRVFGKLLYGSKFAGGMQSRGQQGIGISASLLYAQLTTGKPAKIYSRTSPSKPTYYCEIRIDTTKNEPIILDEKFIKDGFRDHGVTIELEIEGKMISGSHSVDEYIYQTTISNPYATIIYEKPDSTKLIFKRTVEELPPLPKPIKPHPHGVELGVFERMLKLTDSRTISGFLTNEFSRIGSGTADQLCKLANIKPNTKPKELNHIQIERLWKIMQTFNFMKPPTDCLSPIGEENFISGLKRKYKADFYAATTREPFVYRGNPFQIEVCMAYGGSLPQNESAKILRFANRVPLIYQASSCAITKAIQKIDWKHYGIDMQNNLPFGPIVIAVHMASVWIPYTSESKEAIDPYPVILKEIKLALQDCARKIQRYIAGKRRREEASQRIGLFEKYIPEVAHSIAYLSEEDEKKIKESLEKMLKKSDILKNIQEESD